MTCQACQRKVIIGYLDSLYKFLYFCFINNLSNNKPVKKEKPKPKCDYPRQVNELDCILEVLDDDFLNHPVHIGDLENYVENKLKSLYAKKSDDDIFSNFKLVNKRPTLYASLEELDKNGLVNYEKSFGAVSITAKGRQKLSSGGHKLDFDLKNAENIVKLTQPSRLKRNECYAIAAIIISAIALIVTILDAIFG